MNNSQLRSGSAWTAEQVDAFLDATVIPARLAVLAGNGVPLICSLWFRRDGDSLWCATQQTARLTDWLEADPRCGFEIAPETPPYKGVRGQGRAALLPGDGPATLGLLIDRYLGSRDSEFARWLLDRSDGEVAIRVDPDWITAWDFTERMTA